jgi:hypothetical protein
MAEQKVKTKKKFWGKPSKPEKQEGKELAYRLLGGGLTLILSAAIIAIGFALPGLIYPYIDSYNNSFVQLSRPTESTPALAPPEEPILLPPWDTYKESRLSTLSDEELSKLEASGAADYLISVMRDRGMRMPQNTSYYQNKILNDFRRLDPEVAGDPRFFVLYAEDLNTDGTSDFRCAFDYDGKLITWNLLSSEWENVQLNAPIAIMDASSNSAGEGTANEASNLSEPDGSGAESDPPTDNNEATNEEDPNGTSPQDPDNDTTNNSSNGSNSNNPPPSSIMRPVGEEMSLWAFSYATSREAHNYNQMDVFNAFRQLDIYYALRYSYSFDKLLPNPLTEPEVFPKDPLYALSTPDYYTTEEYRLKIYRLGTGAKLILYINRSNDNCVGFNLQQYNPTAPPA